MKKRIAAFATAALSLFAMMPSFASAETANADTKSDFVVLGDSIASGFTRKGNVEYTYGDILADYYKGNISNFSVPGYTTDDMNDFLKNLSADNKTALTNAEYIVISIGGNDIINYSVQYLLQYCIKHNFLAEGYTAENIPAEFGLTELLDIIDTEALKEYANGNMQNKLELATTLSELTSNIAVNSNQKNCLIKESIMPNITAAVAEIKKINPNAEIIIQNIYQPLQIDQNVLTDSYKTIANQLRSSLETIMKNFNTELTEIAAESGIKVADILTEFTSLESGVSKSASTPGNAKYFVDIQNKDLKQGDIHPNQKGHLAIAAEIIDTIGEKHNDYGILSEIYETLEDKDAYPAVALQTYKSAAGEYKLGDVNFDSKIDATDASTVLTEYANTSAGRDVTFTYRQRLAGNVVDDKGIDAQDASLILTFYANSSAGGTNDFLEFIEKNK